MISACRTEWIYRDDILWQVPNCEFGGVYADTEWMAGHIRTGDFSEFSGDWRVAVPLEGSFEKVCRRIRHYSDVAELVNDAEVVQATLDLPPIAARTEVWSEDGETRATIEYPDSRRVPMKNTFYAAKQT